MKHFQLRKRFSDFWKSKNHVEVPPISLVPQNDPTTLFTGSGMQPLVPNLLGKPHELGRKLYNIQPCFRSQDIEEIGDNRHTTFFEMMGNWSLGTYFKKEQLAWFWEFLTKELKLPKEKLYVSVFEGTKDLPEDRESFEIWKSLGVPEEKIFKYGPDKNWWSRAGVPENMPAGEPGGPDSEVFYEFTQIQHDPKYGKTCHPNCNCGRFLEIGNSVFMEYKKNKDGSFSELPNKNVDFGGGLERILAAVNNEPDVFKTDILWSAIEEIQKISKKNYLNDQKPIRIISDHIKASVFIILSGIKPSNRKQEYVLRKLLRRSMVMFARLMDRDIKEFLSDYTFEPIIKSVINIYEKTYPELREEEKQINNIIKDEQSRFFTNMKTAYPALMKIINKDSQIITGDDSFDLFESHGILPVVLEEVAKRFNKKIDWETFNKKVIEHQKLSRTASTGMFKGGLADHSEQTLKYHTATHLLHQALFDVLGNDIRQEGSNITVERLRFDFYSGKKPTDEEIKKVGEIINKKIKESFPVSFKIMPKEEALKLGARSFFREKYPDMVKVYSVGDYSKEFCGGPHVQNTKDIGKIEIYQFEKIGSNLYRIYAK